MRPTELIVRNYRSFAGEHRVALRPLTLLFGDNSAGKSALVRALPLLADAVAPYAKGPLPLESAALGGSGFHDLRFKGQLHDGDGAHLGLGLGWGSDESARSVVFGQRADLREEPADHRPNHPHSRVSRGQSLVSAALTRLRC